MKCWYSNNCLHFLKHAIPFFQDLKRCIACDQPQQLVEDSTWCQCYKLFSFLLTSCWSFQHCQMFVGKAKAYRCGTPFTHRWLFVLLTVRLFGLPEEGTSHKYKLLRLKTQFLLPRAKHTSFQLGQVLPFSVLLTVDYFPL